MDRLREVSRCPYGITVEIVLIRASLDSVTSSVFRLVDLAISIAIILSSPLVWGELLNPDTLRYASCDVNVDSVLTKCEYRRSPHFVIFGTKRVPRNSGITNFETLFRAKSQIGPKNFLKSTFLAIFSVFKSQNTIYY